MARNRSPRTPGTQTLIFGCRPENVTLTTNQQISPTKGDLMRQHLLTALLCLAIPAAAGAQSIAHGKYTVEGTSMCNDCHTPRDEKGQLILSRALQGAPLGSQPVHPMPWADFAPPIAGLPGSYTPEQMVAFLQTGKRPDGTMPRPPMPPYRFTRSDALSLTAYLRTLKK
jgi:cytochrome c553